MAGLTSGLTSHTNLAKGVGGLKLVVIAERSASRLMNCEAHQTCGPTWRERQAAAQHSSKRVSQLHQRTGCLAKRDSSGGDALFSSVKHVLLEHAVANPAQGSVTRCCCLGAEVSKASEKHLVGCCWARETRADATLRYRHTAREAACRRDLVVVFTDRAAAPAEALFSAFSAMRAAILGASTRQFRRASRGARRRWCLAHALCYDHPTLAHATTRTARAASSQLRGLRRSTLRRMYSTARVFALGTRRRARLEEAPLGPPGTQRARSKTKHASCSAQLM